MSKIRIPIWDNGVDFPKEIENVGLMLLALSDRDYQVRVWAKAEGPEVEWFDEAFFDVDLQIGCLKDKIRSGEVKLSKEQIKAILRIPAMFNHLNRSFKYKIFPQEHTAHEMAIIDDPYFAKIRRHAAYAVSLIRLPVPRGATL